MTADVPALCTELPYNGPVPTSYNSKNRGCGSMVSMVAKLDTPVLLCSVSDGRTTHNKTW